MNSHCFLSADSFCRRIKVSLSLFRDIFLTCTVHKRNENTGSVCPGSMLWFKTGTKSIKRGGRERASAAAVAAAATAEVHTDSTHWRASPAAPSCRCLYSLKTTCWCNAHTEEEEETPLQREFFESIHYTCLELVHENLGMVPWIKRPLYFYAVIHNTGTASPFSAHLVAHSSSRPTAAANSVSCALSFAIHTHMYCTYVYKYIFIYKAYTVYLFFE